MYIIEFFRWGSSRYGSLSFGKIVHNKQQAPLWVLFFVGADEGKDEEHIGFEKSLHSTRICPIHLRYNINWALCLHSFAYCAIII